MRVRGLLGFLAVPVLLALGGIWLLRAESGADHIPPGYRGMTVAIPAHEWQYVKPYSRVDVLSTFEAMFRGGRKEWVTATILQNVLVMKTTPPAGKRRMGTVQLAVNPNEGQYLALTIDSKKKYDLTVRPAKDLEMRPLEMAAFMKLLREKQ